MAKTNPSLQMLKGLIWLYLVLMLTEGALRKWYLPSLATPLLIVRDPVVIAIYFVAITTGRFPVNGYVIVTIMLAVLSFIAGLLTPTSNLYITLIGERCYFLHLPLIFVMQRTLSLDDVFRMGKFLLWVSIPMTVLIIAQFYSPQTAWVNLQIGGLVGEGFSGALGRFRPSGTFSFIAGVSAFYPLVLAMLLGFLISHRKLMIFLAIAAGVSVLLSIPFSISRTNLIACAMVMVCGGIGLLVLPKPPLMMARLILILGLVFFISSSFSFFDEGVKTFQSRWDDSSKQEMGGVQNAIVNRYFEDLVPGSNDIFETSLLGAGIGYGTNMAQAYLTGNRTFALGESEWPRLIREMGPILGLCFIGLRIALTAGIIMTALKSLSRNNILPTLLGAPAFFLVLNAQWGQPTILGFAMFTTGLCFAAAKKIPSAISAATETPRPRKRRHPSWRPAGIHSGEFEPRTMPRTTP